MDEHAPVTIGTYQKPRFWGPRSDRPWPQALYCPTCQVARYAFIGYFDDADQQVISCGICADVIRLPAPVQAQSDATVRTHDA